FPSTTLFRSSWILVTINSGTDNRQQGTKSYSMTAWLGTRVCFIDLTWSKRPGRRPLRFSKPGTIIRQLNFQIMLRAPGDRKQPCALSNAISIIGFPRTGCSEIDILEKQVDQDGVSLLIRFHPVSTKVRSLLRELVWLRVGLITRNGNKER